jgi:hypothetical protein
MDIIQHFYYETATLLGGEAANEKKISNSRINYLPPPQNQTL